MTLAALAALTLGGGIAPALAQYYGDGYDRPRRREFREEYERPRRGPEGYYYGRERALRREGFGRICVTARGNCPTRPGPINAPCGCEIPGFGLKRGQIGY
ncbi:conserved hypothetical protein [Methylobacterium sp. 4-46]|uniref:hypothetical protein n=1 Tax=Methylobacterium sp. CB376 TaxID=3138063 RepID=UPI000165C5EC|nr:MULTISPECIES: hypothetical protein [Methylobacterium]ACA17079.1 conserved hypothetical protein [Methylobacterium sp. 4-46]WFT83568.1 hypothetical protein QA634_13385 [Methylobacterium nodulans]